MNPLTKIIRKIGGVGARVSRFIGEKFETRKKALLVCAVGALVLFAGMPHVANAAWWPFNLITDLTASAITDLGFWAMGKSIYLTNVVSAYIGAILISILAWFVGIVLNLNYTIIQTEAVQVGFSVSLSVANLGFVFGIIVIAIATILRSQTYGLKQILWKLVVAAILVNFSLVIVAPIINFSNQLTSYFLSCMQGNCRNNASTLSGFKTFATSLTAAFNPQKAFVLGIAGDPDSNLEGAFATVGGSIGKIMAPIASIFFISGMLIVICITLIAFVVMLFIRYLTLGILLILMPFAWLMWVFPNTKDMWSKWWKTFWRWTLFAPIVVFFLYLAIMTSNIMSNPNPGSSPIHFTTYEDTTAGSTFKMLSDTLGKTFTPLLGAFMGQLLIIGLAIGGIFAANSMSIHGASAAMGAIKGGAKAFATYVGKRGARAAAALGSKTMNKVASSSLLSNAAAHPRTPQFVTNTIMGTSAAIGKVATKLGNLATHPGLKTKGLFNEVWGGMKKGSGLFKGKYAKDWECQHCDHVERQAKKPTTACSSCGSSATTANWTEI